MGFRTKIILLLNYLMIIFKKSLSLATKFLHNDKFKDVKIIDARIKNQVILND